MCGDFSTGALLYDLGSMHTVSNSGRCSWIWLTGTVWLEE